MGYDHHFVVPGEGLRSFAKVWEPGSGRTMEVLSDADGFQFFCGKAMNPAVKGKEGRIYGGQSAFCIETQGFPNSPNQSNFPSILIHPDQEYISTTIYAFGVEED